MVNGYVQNRQQPRLEVLFEIAKILDVEVKELLVELKITKQETAMNKDTGIKNDPNDLAKEVARSTNFL